MAPQIVLLTRALIEAACPEEWWKITRGPNRWDLVMSLANRGSAPDVYRHPVDVSFDVVPMRGDSRCGLKTTLFPVRIETLSIYTGSEAGFCFTAIAKRQIDLYPSFMIVGHYCVIDRSGACYEYESPTT